MWVAVGVCQVMAEEDTLCIYVKNEVCRPPAALHTQHRRVADPVLSNAERSCTCATLTMALFVCAADDGGSGFSKPRGCRASVRFLLQLFLGILFWILACCGCRGSGVGVRVQQCDHDQREWF